jgi:hypothetical protein
LHIAASVDTGYGGMLEAHSSGVRLSARITASGIAVRVWIELEALEVAILATVENLEESAETIHQFPTSSPSEPSFLWPIFL